MGWQNMAARLKTFWERTKIKFGAFILERPVYVCIYLYPHLYDLYLCIYRYLYLPQFKYRQDIILKLCDIFQKLPGLRKYTITARGMI